VAHTAVQGKFANVLMVLIQQELEYVHLQQIIVLQEYQQQLVVVVGQMQELEQMEFASVPPQVKHIPKNMVVVVQPHVHVMLVKDHLMDAIVLAVDTMVQMESVNVQVVSNILVVVVEAHKEVIVQ